MALFVVIGFPLTVSSLSIGRDTARESRVRTAASAWGDEIGWELLDVITADSRVTVRMIGPPPLPDPHGLRSHLQAQRVDPSVVIAEFIPKTTVDLADDPTSPPAEAASAVELREARQAPGDSEVCDRGAAGYRRGLAAHRPPSSSGLGHHPLKVAARVRIPLGVLV